MRAETISMGKVYIPPKLSDKPIAGGLVKWGDNNDFPQKIIKQYNASPTHGAIVRTKAKLITGSGIQVEDEAIDLNKLAGGRINKLMRKISLDFSLHNAFAIQVGWSVDRTQVVRMTYMDISKVREFIDEETQDLLAYKCATHWKKDLNSTKDVISLPPFDPADAAEVDENGEFIQDGNQLFVYYGHCPGSDWYTVPEYYAALTDIQTDIEYRDFNLSNVQGGLMPTLIMQVLKAMDDDEWEDFKRDIKGRLQGATGEKYIMLRGDMDDEGNPYLKIDTVDNKGGEEKFIETHKSAIQQILSSHQVPSPMLAGLPGGNSLNGKGREMEFGYQMFEENVISDMREQIIDEMAEILDRGGYPGIALTIDPRNPFEFSKESTTDNEAEEQVTPLT